MPELSAVAQWLTVAVLLAYPAKAMGAGSTEVTHPSGPPATAPDAASLYAWEIGATAAEDVVVPLNGIAFSSVDPEEAARAKARAAAEVTPIFRFVSRTADEALAEFETLVAGARRGFQKATAEQFGPLPLDAKAFLGDDFDTFRLRWADEHPGLFVPSPALARKWATELDDASLLNPCREALRAVLAEQRICDTNAVPPVDAFSACRIVSTAYRQTEISSDVVARHASIRDRRELLSLPRARELLGQRLSEVEPGAEFVSRFLRPNTLYEAALTEAERVLRAEQAAVPAREYLPGDVIVREGEVIGPRVFAALTDFQAMLASLTPPADPAVDESATAAGTAIEPQLASAEPSPFWMSRTFVAVAAFCLLAVIAAAVWASSRLSRRTALSVLGADSNTAESPVVVALRDTTVQHLFSQRQHWLADQERSTDRVSALEERIAELQPRIQAKIRAYEAHITELESMLAAKRGIGTGGIEKEIERLRRKREEQIERGPVAGSR